MAEIMGLPLTWFIAYGVIMLVAFTIASTLGMGGPLLVMPPLLLMFPAAEAVALIVPVIWCNNVGRAILHRKFLDWEATRRSALFAVPLTLLAAYFTASVPNTILKLLIIALIAYALGSRYLFKIDLKVGKKGLIGWGIPIGLFTGLMGTSGPPMAIAYKGYGLVLRHFIATFSTLQIVLQLVRLPGYFNSGLLHQGNLPLALYFAACGLPGIFIARPFIHRINADFFRKAIDVLLLLIALSMLIDVLND